MSEGRVSKELFFTKFLGHIIPENYRVRKVEVISYADSCSGISITMVNYH